MNTLNLIKLLNDKNFTKINNLINFFHVKSIFFFPK